MRHLVDSGFRWGEKEGGRRRARRREGKEMVSSVGGASGDDPVPETRQER